MLSKALTADQEPTVPSLEHLLSNAPIGNLLGFYKTAFYLTLEKSEAILHPDDATLLAFLQEEDEIRELTRGHKESTYTHQLGPSGRTTDKNVEVVLL